MMIHICMALSGVFDLLMVVTFAWCPFFLCLLLLHLMKIVFNLMDWRVGCFLNWVTAKGGILMN